MRTDPISKKEPDKEAFALVIKIIAIIIAFCSVFFLYAKMLFL